MPVLPVGGDQVGEGGRVGLHRYGGAVEPGQEQGHVGVRGAGRGVGHLGGRAFRVSGIGDVPPGDGGLVDPRDEQGGAVRGPPVTAMAVHLLGRDELGQPERDPRRALRVRERAVFGAVAPLAPLAPLGPLDPLGPLGQPGHPQRAVADVGQPPSGRVGPGIQGRGARGHLAGWPAGQRSAGQRHGVHAAGQREGGHRDRLVGGVGDDAARLLPDPLPPGPLLRRQVLLAGAFPVGPESPRVGHQALLPGVHIEHPQARRRVGAALGPQVGDPGAVGGDAERARHPEREPPGPGLLPGEALGHAPNLVARHSWCADRLLG